MLLAPEKKSRTLKRTNKDDIVALIPRFKEQLIEGWSPVLAAKKCGFDWMYWQPVLIGHPDFAEFWDEYCRKRYNRKLGFS